MIRALRVFDPGEQPGTSLRAFFTDVFQPLRAADRGEALDWKTVECYLETVAWWERITGDRLIEQTTEDDVEAFIGRLRMQPGRRRGSCLAVATVRKHAANLRSLLRAAAPAGSTPHGTGVLSEAVQVRLPRRHRKMPFGHMTLADIEAIARGCDRLRAPRPTQTGVAVGVWWRGLLGWLYFTGCRIEETLLARWEWLQPDGEVHIPGRARKHNVPHITFCHPRLLELLEPLRVAGRSPYVFPYYDDRKTDGRRLRQLIRRLTRAHELVRGHVGARKVPGACWHGYRKTHLTELAQVSLAAAQISSSHGGGGLLQGYYLDARRTLREGILQLPIPQF